MFQYLLKELGSMADSFLKCINGADLITVTSRSQQADIQAHIPHAEIIYNPVDTSFFTSEEDQKDFALVIARMEPEKGIDLLIGALQNVDDLKVKIAGEGTERDRLTSQIEMLGLQHRVELLGEQNRFQIRDFLNDCSFLILPSKYETFGNVLLEAMSCGKPVVATKSGGPLEIINKNTGILCDANKASLEGALIEMKMRRKD